MGFVHAAERVVVRVSRAGFLLRRVGFAVVAVYLVVSVTFLFVAVPPDPGTASVEWQAAMASGGDEEQVRRAVRAYEEARNLDEPLADRYVGWLVDITTLDWGRSLESGRPVLAVLGSALPYTALYVVPAMLLSVVLGLGVGVFAALHGGTWKDRLAATSTYLGASFPNFWLGQIAFFVLVFELQAIGITPGMSPTGGPLPGGTDPLAPYVLLHMVPAALVLSTSLVGGQVRYARAQAHEYVGSEFVKLLRAKGASGPRVARHVLRNAAIPLLSLFFTEMLAVLVLNVYVIEAVFNIPGLGAVTLEAIRARDVPVVLGATMVVVVVGVGGNLFQDLAYASLDPRVGED